MIEATTLQTDPAEQSAPGFVLTYGELRSRVRTRLVSQAWKPSRVANFMVTFNDWCRLHELEDDQLVGREMNEDFDDNLVAYQEWLTAQGKSGRTCRDRLDFLLLLRKCHDALSRLDDLPALFADALRMLLVRDSRTRMSIAREAGIPIQTLEGWLAERRAPRQDSSTHVRNLETVLGVPHRTLSSRLDRRPFFTTKSDRAGQTHFGRRMRKIIASGERVRIEPTQRLREQWLELVRYKTNPLRDSAEARSIWRTKVPNRSGVLPSWDMIVDGLICPTAGSYWSLFSGYLGWLSRPQPEGAGVPVGQADTLAWFVHTEFFLRYVAWRIARAEGDINNGTLNLLRFAKSVLRPETGFMWSSTWLVDTLPSGFRLNGQRLDSIEVEDRPDIWRRACVAAHDALVKRIEIVSRSNRVKRSRDPREPIQAILAQPEPLRVVLDMVSTMQSLAPPKRQGRVFHVWLRDLLLMQMLCTNPIRVSQFAVMTYRSDNSGNLYQTVQGAWRLRFKAEDFKNQAGAAYEAYDVSVPRSVWPTIQRYLSESRPYLIGATACDFLFLPRTYNGREGLGMELNIDRGGMWNGEAISERVRELTMRYLPGNPPFGGHAIRHIVATDYLKRVPGDYPTVARLLHDELATVLKEYAHMDVDTGLRKLHSYIDDIWE